MGEVGETCHNDKPGQKRCGSRDIEVRNVIDMRVVWVWEVDR